MVSDSFQLVSHKNLRVNFHYSVGSHNRLNMLFGYSKCSDIELKVYTVEESYTNFEDILVLNHFKNTQKRFLEGMLE